MHLLYFVLFIRQSCSVNGFDKVSVYRHCSFKEEKHLEFGFEEFPQVLVDYLDCCIEWDSEEDRE